MKEIKYKDPRMEEIINIVQENDKLFFKKKKESAALLEYCTSKNVEEISWTEICELGKSKKIRECNSFCLIKALVSKKLYKNDYSEDIYRVFKELNPGYNPSRIDIIMCGADIKYFMSLTNYNGRNENVIFRVPNDYILEEVRKFLSVAVGPIDKCNSKIVDNIAASFQKIIPEATSYKDFNENTFWAQIDYAAKGYSRESKEFHCFLVFLINFYRYMAKTYDDCHLFADALSINQGMLFNAKLFRLIKDDYYFSPLSLSNTLLDKKKICFAIRKKEQSATGATETNTFKAFDFSRIKTDIYRKSLIKYAIVVMPVRTISPELVSDLVPIMAFLENLKATANYENPCPTSINAEECFLISQFVDSEDISIASKNSRGYSIKNFFKYCVSEKMLEISDKYGDLFRFGKSKRRNNSCAIPDEEMVLIINYIKEEAKHSSKALAALTAIQLMLTTHLRLSNISNLEIGCIEQGIKANEFILKCRTKTSNGELISETITAESYRILINLINKTEDFRKEAVSAKLEKYIFIYKNSEKSHNSIFKLSTALFYIYINSVCRALNINKKYSSSNFRDTYMTKTVEFAIRNNLNELESKILSGHKKVDTTSNHYLNLKLEDMLESTYGVIIGDNVENIEEKVVEQYPEEIQGKENDVESLCGKCKAKSCTENSSLPCLVCKNFLTTVSHEKHFKKAIDIIDTLVEEKIKFSQACPGAPIRHEIEDLRLKKSLYVAYLKAIYKKKEA